MRIVAGRLKGRALAAPEGRDLRPTADRTRESLFNILAHGSEGARLVGCHFIDGFCGTGAVGLEAFSRGAASVRFIDCDPKPARANVSALGLDGAAELQVVTADLTSLPPAQRPANLVFLDPPYGQGLLPPALATLTSGGWLTEGAVVVTELERTEDLDTPARFSVTDERRYGKAKLIFLRFSGA